MVSCDFVDFFSLFSVMGFCFVRDAVFILPPACALWAIDLAVIYLLAYMFVIKNMNFKSFRCFMVWSRVAAPWCILRVRA